MWSSPPKRCGFQPGYEIVVSFLYVAFLGASAFHLYRTPLYRMDALQYMGNALLMENRDLFEVHRGVYSEIYRSVPGPARDGLLGRQTGAPPDQNLSRELRSHDPYRFSEFLPFFAIRPLYNQLLYLLYKAGFGLFRSTILISAGSYFFLGIVLFAWARQHVNVMFASAFSMLMMMSPPIATLGRENISDALATLVAFGSLYLIFEKRLLTPGLVLALTSIYCRTDFVVLAIPVLVVCCYERKITFFQMTTLMTVAAGSVLLINYCAGDYGLRMLYYRNFVGTPTAPGEMTVLFSFHDYISAFRGSLSLVAGGFFFPFLALGLTGLFCRPRSVAVFGVALAYTGLHFVLLPNWEERWFAIFYLSAGVLAVTGLGQGLSKLRLRGSTGSENLTEMHADQPCENPSYLPTGA
jgi:hypothetical protein